MMYTMKSGLLTRDGSELCRIISSLSGAERSILSPLGDLIAKTLVRFLPADSSSCPVSEKEYSLLDSAGNVLIKARPDCAPDEGDKKSSGSLRLPKVDRAAVYMRNEVCIFTMESPRLYILRFDDGHKVLSVTHRGITGGWDIDCSEDFSPEEICGLFIFCRYIEKENEFLIV